MPRSGDINVAGLCRIIEVLRCAGWRKFGRMYDVVNCVLSYLLY